MAKKDETAARESAEAAEKERVAKAGRDALAAQAKAEAEKSDEERAADAEEARKVADKQAAAEAKQAEAERKSAEKSVKGLPPNTRLLKVGTIFDFHGEEAVLAADAPFTIPHADSEQHFASVLAKNPYNLALNSGSLRLVYNPMNGTPLPLSSQRLAPEEMTPEERSLFGL
jgi:hypothetical protein